MARSKSGKIRKPRKRSLITTVYQIHIKGPERNETLKELFEHVRERLLKGTPLVKADKFGNVIRAIGAAPSRAPKAVELSVVKYNEKNTGLSWDTKREELVDDGNRVTAQRTELVIYPDFHRAVLVQRTHGPSPSQVCFYLFNLFDLSAKELGIECAINIVPLKVSGAVRELRKWKVIKHFEIEVYRPNPDGHFKVKRIRDLIEKSGADKASLAVSAQVERGIKKSGIGDLITEGDRLVQLGQARIMADGLNGELERDKLDSESTKTKKFKIITTIDDDRSLPSLLYESLKKWFS